MTQCSALISILLLVGSRTLSAQTQTQLNEQAAMALRRADSTLNAVYAQLVARYRTDSAALRKLRQAERAWLAFRDAQVEATYPAADKQAAYGSVYPMCVAKLLAELTEARVAQLRRALTQVEGDVCAGGPG